VNYELFIARRYLRSKQNAGFLSFITFIAVGGVILGVAALVIMLSVTNGFSGEVKSRLIGMDAHVAVKKWHGEPIEAYRELIARLEADPQLTGSAPIVKGKMVLWAEHEQDGALIWGIEPESFGTVSDLPEHLYLADNQINFDPPEGGRLPGIVLGQQLASRLRTGPGQNVYLLTFPSSDVEEVALMGLRPKVHPFVVTDLFQSGMYHYDDNFGFISLAAAQDVLKLGDAVTDIHLRVADLDEATAIGERLSEELGYPYRSTDWTKQFPELFRWMELEKWVIFIAMSLIILVASFNIMSILTMSILIKTPEIGILRAMGSKARSVRRIFVYQGLFIGVFGTALGCIVGYLVCWLQERFDLIAIPSEIYIISNLPVDMQLLDFVLVSVVSLTISLLASVYPARKAAALQPVEAIRYIV
jgi:lipoprotein-releasing system permease protein